MGPFVVFVIVLIFIWTISAISSAANKQREAQRRAQLREQMARAGITVPVAPAAARAPQLRTPTQITAGIAQRFPDVLLPPAPARKLPAFQQRTPRPVVKTQQRQPQRQPQRPVLRQPQRQPCRQPQRQQPSTARRPANAPIAPPPIAAPPVPQPRAAAEMAPVRTSTALPRIGANTLNRWLQPTTLNQQFLLTEILQPPVGWRQASVISTVR